MPLLWKKREGRLLFVKKPQRDGSRVKKDEEGRCVRHLFIINPAAGKKESTTRLKEALANLSFAHEVAYTKEAGDAQRIAREAAERGEPVRIYACGGDGTLNEVVNGAAGYDNAAITCVPKGTGNDFLKIFGAQYRTLFYDLEELAEGPQAPFDLIDCNGHLGIDVVCIGVDARIGADVHKYKNLPLLSGKGAYIMALVEHVLLKGISRPMSVRMGEIARDGDTAVVCVCNGRHYGGGFMPVPEAMPDDGVLDMLLIPKISLFTFARVVGKYAKGLYRNYPDLILSHHGQQATVVSPKETVAVVDGEVLRDTSFTIRLSEKKVNFFFPAAADYRTDRKGGAERTAVSV